MNIELELEKFYKTAYLGDGAYVGQREHDICVFTSDGMSVTNRVYLGESEMEALDFFVQSLKEKNNG